MTRRGEARMTRREEARMMGRERARMMGRERARMTRKRRQPQDDIVYTLKVEERWKKRGRGCFFKAVIIEKILVTEWFKRKK